METTQSAKPTFSLDVVWGCASFALAADLFGDYLQEGSIVAFAFMVLDLQIGYLFWTRNQAMRLPSGDSPWWADCVALVSMGSVVFYEKTAQNVAGVWAFPEWIMVVGAVLCFASCWSLGTSFGVMPRYRGIKQGGLYRLVRHPVYASIVVIELGYLLRHPTGSNLVVGFIGLLLLLARIHYEERLLAHNREYREYQTIVRYRLIPGIW